MPSGSKARTVAPASDKAGRNARLGLSRISSVFGLKVRPSAAKVSPSTLPPQASTTRRAMLRFRASLTRNTVSTIASGAFISSAVRTSAWQSFGKHEPPKPGPACRNLPPTLDAPSGADRHGRFRDDEGPLVAVLLQGLADLGGSREHIT